MKLEHVTNLKTASSTIKDMIFENVQVHADFHFLTERQAVLVELVNTVLSCQNILNVIISDTPIKSFDWLKRLKIHLSLDLELYLHC